MKIDKKDTSKKIRAIIEKESRGDYVLRCYIPKHVSFRDNDTFSFKTGEVNYITFYSEYRQAEKYLLSIRQYNEALTFKPIKNKQ